MREDQGVADDDLLAVDSRDLVGQHSIQYGPQSGLLPEDQSQLIRELDEACGRHTETELAGYRQSIDHLCGDAGGF